MPNGELLKVIGKQTNADPPVVEASDSDLESQKEEKVSRTKSSSSNDQFTISRMSKITTITSNRQAICKRHILNNI